MKCSVGVLFGIIISYFAANIKTMKFNPKILIFLFFTLITDCISAQSGLNSLSINAFYTIDRKTRIDIDTFQVILFPTYRKSADTIYLNSSDRRVQANNLIMGIYTVICSAKGYETVTLTEVRLRADFTTFLGVDFAPASNKKRKHKR